MTDSWTASISLHEARQELLGASYGNRNREALEAEYGLWDGFPEGEIEASRLGLNN